MSQQTHFPLPWGLPYHREPCASPARRELLTYEAPPHTYLDPHLLHAQCKGEDAYRDHYHLHRCEGGACGGGGGGGGGGGAAYKCGGEEEPEPVSSTETAHWDDKLVSSSACVAPREAASPHHPVSSTHAGGRRGALQLWQFLVSLLASGARCVAWTGRGLEFKLHEPEEVARRWGAQKNRPAMNYDKLSRSLRYYYEKGIMQKVAGERYVYKFVCDPEALFSMATPRQPPAYCDPRRCCLPYDR